MCLQILWNLLNYPKETKYRQISDRNLCDNLKSKCSGLKVNEKIVLEEMNCFLEKFGFQKGDNGENWYYQRDANLLSLWDHYNEWINTQPMYYLLYKTKSITKTVNMLKDGQWNEYEIAFDYKHRSIVLLGNTDLNIESLQIGNAKESSLEFDTNIQWYNDFSDVEIAHSKWACLILNHTWHFRVMTEIDRSCLSDFCSEFNSFHVIWKDRYFQTYKEPFNPYSTTFKKAFEHLQKKIQAQEHFKYGTDELIDFKCDYSKCNPPIGLDSVKDDALLHVIYKYDPHSPITSVYWEINSTFMVPYARTVDIKGAYLPKNFQTQTVTGPNEYFLPHQLPYLCDIKKLKQTQDSGPTLVPSKTPMKNICHEIINNGYFADLVDEEQKETGQTIKQGLCFDSNDVDELILDDTKLTIINQIRQIYRSDMHKHMGYPLQLHHICAILLFHEGSCYKEFISDQIAFRYNKWKYSDLYLHEAISILHKHEKREASDIEVYGGLNKVKFDVEKETKLGYFATHLYTSDDFQIAEAHRGQFGCILHFHPSMRRDFNITSCDVSWIFSNTSTREVLFSRSFMTFDDDDDEKKDEKQRTFNVKVESEDEYTQTILLTSATHNQFIQPIEHISNILDYPTDFNLIYLASKILDGNVSQVISVLSRFEKWKMEDANKEKYKQQMNEFVKRRCCNHEVNLLYMFLFEQDYLKGQTALQASILSTVINGLPFIDKDKDKLFETLRPLSSPLYPSQCISFNHEILICGGYHNQECYSYHTVKREYKRICSYPSNVELNGHCVVKLTDDNNSHGITLLSFGGSPKHTLIMKYVSVWDNDVIDVKNESHLNKWMPFTDNNNNPILIGRDEDNYCGARALISGSDNNLLFITYHPKNISVFDLHTFQYIKHSTLPVDSDTQIKYHCFVLKPTHGLSKEKKDKKLHEMMLFCKNTGLTIEYDEDYNFFQFYCVWVCTTIRPFYSYGFVCVDDAIWFFGGSNEERIISKFIHRYSMLKDQWMKFEQTLSMPLTGCVTILNGDNTHIHIIGGYNENGTLSTHIKTKVKNWMMEKTKMQINWIEKEEEKRYIEKNETEKKGIEEINKELKTMTPPDFKKLKKVNEVSQVIKHWTRLLLVKMGWIDQFDIIVARYILRKYFRPFKIIQKQGFPVNIVRFSPDGSKIVSASEDITITIWDIESGKIIGVLIGHSNTINDVQFSPDGHKMLSCSDDNTIILWDVELCTPIIKLEGHEERVTNARFSPDGSTIVSGSADKTIRIWDVNFGRELMILERSAGEINHTEFSPDGQQIMVVAQNQNMKIIDLQTGKVAHKFNIDSQNENKARFSSDGCFIISCSWNIKLWDVMSARQIKLFDVRFSRIIDVKFLPDDKTILSCASDNTVQLLDVKVGVPTQQLEESIGSVTAIDITSDGNTIAVSSKNGTIRLWDSFPFFPFLIATPKNDVTFFYDIYNQKNNFY
ncbi:G-protein beta WD-40 repeats containing protein [Reticulomyxa filosa]|uniref:G-protein beta WD-40 repeats containing protein n=1 Tax=Reticulomyxa filosa TaxID=46433 RepID=X6M191_RETFI|nr:G-protein beta WD-40 repeats containing protein [Reticulomyxa filosa]|eukprot:ETO07197.1 G-protein beta WD-40 repeats containing protein [Reticulomyxa filosa]